jgi:hypothetical protein
VGKRTKGKKAIFFLFDVVLDSEKNEKLLVIRFSFVSFFFRADFVVLCLGSEEINKYQNEFLGLFWIFQR